MNNNNIVQNKGHGYKKDNAIICMVRCFECGKENWAIAVHSGYCAWCNYTPNKIENKEND